MRDAIVRYVLGEMTEAEAAAVEAAYFADPQQLAAVWEVFDDLARLYVIGGLGATEQQKFEERLRSRPFLRERMERWRSSGTDLVLLSPTDPPQ
jgi:anti-sigma factor RsiW